MNTESGQKLDEVSALIPDWNKALATPAEFASHILATLSMGSMNGDGLDQHWRPQFLDCSICKLNYTVFAKVG